VRGQLDFSFIGSAPIAALAPASSDHKRPSERPGSSPLGSRATITIPRDAVAIHGITTERALAEGIPLATALQKFAQDVRTRSPSLAIAHNMAFDRPVLLAEHIRAGLAEPLTSLPTHCTMVTTTELCRLPPFRYGKHNWPKLAELHYQLFGMDFGAGHHAGADVKTCATCYFKLRRRGLTR
jgi:DNA polymerase-3 subunit epsilon